MMMMKMKMKMKMPSICSPFSNIISNFFFRIVYNFQPFANLSQYFSNLFNQWPMTLIFICSIFFLSLKLREGKRQHWVLGGDGSKSYRWWLQWKCRVFPWETQMRKEKNRTSATNVCIHHLWKAAWEVILHVITCNNYNPQKRKVIQMRPMRICFCSCTQFENTFENAQGTKVKQMQPMWLCICPCNPFEDTFENSQWRKLKQMQTMWLCACWS